MHLGKWGYGSGWVDISIGLYVAALALGGLGGQHPKQARRLATELAGRNAPINDELRALLDDPVSRTENHGSLVLILVTVAIMFSSHDAPSAVVALTGQERARLARSPR